MTVSYRKLLFLPRKQDEELEDSELFQFGRWWRMRHGHQLDISKPCEGVVRRAPIPSWRRSWLLHRRCLGVLCHGMTQNAISHEPRTTAFGAQWPSMPPEHWLMTTYTVEMRQNHKKEMSFNQKWAINPEMSHLTRNESKTIKWKCH